MGLTLGTRLGPYEVSAAIGAGGRGEVYKATDTNLGRQVAVKVLPVSLVSDPERIARFEREAKTLAALNHPNIARIYGLKTTDDIRALVIVLAILLATMVSLAGCGGNPVAPSAPPAPGVSSSARGKVAIISIDGLRPDALLTVGAPNILALADRGAYTWQAQTILPSLTLPSHVSMLTGFTPDVHGIVWDDYIKERGPIPVPTLFSVARSFGRRTAVMAGKQKFTYFCEGSGSDVCAITSNGDDEVASGAVNNRAVDLLFVHLPDVDVNGHSNGWMSDAYLTAVRRADLAVGRIVSSLPADTTVIFSADHGGHLSEHGSSQASDMTIPWIIAGPRIAQGRRLSSAIRTVDTAATAAYVLGFPLQPGAAGRPVLEAFATPDHQTAAGLQTGQRRAASLPDR